MGCTELQDVKDELAKGGYALWYPARAGVEPGQIWIIDGKTKVPNFERPSAVGVNRDVPAQFSNVKKHVEAGVSLDATFGLKVAGAAEELKAALSAGTVKDVKLDFGTTVIDELVMENFRRSLPQLDGRYRAAVEKVRRGNDNLVLVVATVRAAGMKYTLKCEDSAKLTVQLPRIQALINAKIEANVKSNTDVEWTIPSTESLTIAFTPAKGDWLDLETNEIRKRINVDLKQDDQRSKINSVELLKVTGR